jgi:hypothetical protein
LAFFQVGVVALLGASGFPAQREYQAADQEPEGNRNTGDRNHILELISKVIWAASALLFEENQTVIYLIVHPAGLGINPAAKPVHLFENN